MSKLTNDFVPSLLEQVSGLKGILVDRLDFVQCVQNDHGNRDELKLILDVMETKDGSDLIQNLIVNDLHPDKRPRSIVGSDLKLIKSGEADCATSITDTPSSSSTTRDTDTSGKPPEIIDTNSSSKTAPKNSTANASESSKPEAKKTNKRDKEQGRQGSDTSEPPKSKAKTETCKGYEFQSNATSHTIKCAATNLDEDSDNAFCQLIDMLLQPLIEKSGVLKEIALP